MVCESVEFPPQVFAEFGRYVQFTIFWWLSNSKIKYEHDDSLVIEKKNNINQLITNLWTHLVLSLTSMNICKVVLEPVVDF